MPKPKIPVREIIALASAAFGVGAAAIYGPAKPQPIARARQAAYLIANEHGWTMAHIGRVLARDHKTVSYGITNAREVAKRDELYRERCAALRGFVERRQQPASTHTAPVLEMGAQAV